MNVLEELIDDDERIVDKKYVERRVDDWSLRIEQLYANVASWLPEGWFALHAGDVAMHEELMQRFGVPERHLPLLILERDGETRARMEPRGLWIIGANGRVDLIGRKSHFLIIDRAESFEPANWQVSALDDRFREEPLTAARLLEMLA